MKRLVVRIVALVALVGLGLWAIAQVQRSLDTPKAAVAAEPQPSLQSRVPPPEFEAPRVLSPSGVGGSPAPINPLRPRTATLVTPAAATQAAEPPLQPAQPSVPSSDPFSLPRPRNAADAAPPVVLQPAAPTAIASPAMAIEAAPAQTPAAAPPSVRPAVEAMVGDRYASRVPVAAPAPVAATPAAASPASTPLTAPPVAAPPALAERSPSTPPNAVAVQPPADASQTPAVEPSATGPEPQRLRVDPFAAPARLSSSPGVPRTEPARTAPKSEGSGQPGNRQLEGPQAPQLVVQKLAPPAVQVGKPALFRIAVKNVGPVPAHRVEIRDQLPRGMELVDTKPRASRGAEGELVWELGSLKPGEESVVEVQLMPTAEGELGSVAVARFQAEASARTISTRPQLTVKCSAPKSVLIGEAVALSILVANPGTGVAEGIVLTEQVPVGLQHAAGTELEYDVGTLKPGESRQIQLSLAAVRAGRVTNALRVVGDGNLKAEDQVEIEVTAPQLDLALDGPKRRYLEREATYVFSVANPGTAPAKRVELVAHLPRGLKFVAANNAGQYQPATQTVHWLLEELPANDTDKVELVTLPVEAGEQKLRLLGKAQSGLQAEREQAVVVEGIAAIKFEVVDVNDPIEKGGETLYEIRVVNQGSKTATNVRLTAHLPEGLRAIAAEGPTRHALAPNRVDFEGQARLAAKADSVYRVRVQGVQPGDLRIRVELQTDEMQAPVTKEESTRVYADE